MMQHGHHRFTLVSFTLVGTIASTTHCVRTLPPPSAAAIAAEAPLEPFNDEEVLATYEDLALRLDMPSSTRLLLGKRLEDTLANEHFEPKRKGIHAVMVYAGFEGGLILKVTSGNGLVSFKHHEARKIELRGSSLGAQIGASREWGVGLVLGLSKAGYFGGAYEGASAKATLITASAVVHKLWPVTPPSEAAKHRIYAIGRGHGASADAGGTHVKITYPASASNP